MRSAAKTHCCSSSSSSSVVVAGAWWRVIGRVYAPVFAFSRVLSRSCRTSLASATTMASAGDQEESAKLWKVNRTIHELVKDRVSARVMACRKGRDELLVSQGFQVSDDEINMDLTNFRAHYASQTGNVE